MRDPDIEARITVLSDALKSISKNTCCDNCQEAALVARSALASYVGPRTDAGKYRRSSPSLSLEEMKMKMPRPIPCPECSALAPAAHRLGCSYGIVTPILNRMGTTPEMQKMYDQFCGEALTDEIIDLSLSEFFDVSPRSDWTGAQRVAMRKAIQTPDWRSKLEAIYERMVRFDSGNPNLPALKEVIAAKMYDEFGGEARADLVRRLRQHDGHLGLLVEEAADALEAALAATPGGDDVLRDALGQIAGKNDLSGVPDDDLESAARNALYECELIARAALAATPAVGGEPFEWHWRALDDAGKPTSKWFVVDGSLEEFERDMEADSYELRPLYAAQPASPLRGIPESIKKVLLIADDVVWYDWSNNDRDASHTMDQLRLALLAIASPPEQPAAEKETK